MGAEQILLVNPRRRRKRSAARRKSRVRSRVRRVSRRRLRAVNPRRRHHGASHRVTRRRRRNPRLGGLPSVKGIISQLIPAATGAVGAVGLDIALAYIPIPDAYKSGWVGTGVKVLGAVGLGMIAGKVVGKQKGHLFTAGALTVIAYQVIRQLAQSTLGTSVKGLSGVGDFADMSLGAYMPRALPAPAPGMSGMGAYMNPAAVLNGLDGGQSGGSAGYYGNDGYYG